MIPGHDVVRQDDARVIDVNPATGVGLAAGNGESGQATVDRVEKGDT